MKDTLINEVNEHITFFTMRANAQMVSNWQSIVARLNDVTGGISDENLEKWYDQAKRFRWPRSLQTLPKVIKYLSDLDDNVELPVPYAVFDNGNLKWGISQPNEKLKYKSYLMYMYQDGFSKFGDNSKEVDAETNLAEWAEVIATGIFGEVAAGDNIDVSRDFTIEVVAVGKIQDWTVKKTFEFKGLGVESS